MDNTKKSRFFEFPLGWLLAFTLDFFCLFWISQSGLKLPFVWWEYVGCFLVFFSAKKIFYALSDVNFPCFKRTASASKFFLGGEHIILCLNVGAALCVLSYLCCTWNYPLADQALNRIDQAIGFDWVSITHFSLRGPQHALLENAYDSLMFQLIFFSIWFAFLFRKDRLYEIFWIMFLSLLVTVVISGFLPALGPASVLGLVDSLYSNPVHSQNISDVLSIRSAAGGPVVISDLGGMVVFPSFHTASAFLYMYAFRKSGGLGYVAILLNIVMLVSIPAFGDHYLVDMLAGFFVAAISILTIRKIAQKYSLPFAVKESAVMVRA